MAGATTGTTPLGPVRRTVRETGLGLVTLGVAILLFVAYQLFGTNIAANASQAKLKRSFEHQVSTAAPVTGTKASGTTGSGTGAGGTATGGTGTADDATVGAAPTSPSTPTGGAIDHLVIPAISLDKYVVEGTDESDLSQGPGHYLGTPYPGQAGDVAIAGHRTTYGAPFFRIGELKPGDDIYLTNTSDHTYHYVVSGPNLVVSPNDVSVIGPTTTATLTLTTCNPPLSATSRLIVKAKLVGTQAPVVSPQPATAVTPAPAAPTRGPPATADAARPNLTGGSSSAWPDVAAWGAAVVVLWILTRLAINRTRRWRRAGAYVVGIAACGVPLWPCFESVARLLPQSI